MAVIYNPLIASGIIVTILKETFDVVAIIRMALGRFYLGNCRISGRPFVLKPYPISLI
jgi:hypothetical protein